MFFSPTNYEFHDAVKSLVYPLSRDDSDEKFYIHHFNLDSELKIATRQVYDAFDFLG